MLPNYRLVKTFDISTFCMPSAKNAASLLANLVPRGKVIVSIE